MKAVRDAATSMMPPMPQALMRQLASENLWLLLDVEMEMGLGQLLGWRRVEQQLGAPLGPPGLQSDTGL